MSQSNWRQPRTLHDSEGHIPTLRRLSHVVMTVSERTTLREKRLLLFAAVTLGVCHDVSR
ncbi:hypothetical protein [Paraburkholderia sp. JHI869]|uniref:hypothetical protein n=1 Tax=Paraburkholderia sp. JHI869 TaxID=3112959 RepID=UPI003181399B